MSLGVPMCTSCGRAAFPPRLLCPGCGAAAWRTEGVDSGVLEAQTVRDGVGVGAVRTPLGPLVVVRLEGAPPIGAEVSLDQDGDVPVAR